MGGKNTGYFALFGAAISRVADSIALAKAVGKACSDYNVAVLGGDTVSSNATVLSITIIGSPSRNLLKRGGANPMDIVCISRELGGARMTLEKRLKHYSNNKNKIVNDKFTPEIELGALLGNFEGVTSAIDISDGLGCDLARIAEESFVQISVESALIPLYNDKTVTTDYAVSSGEEYALAFTVSPDRLYALQQEIDSKLSRKIYPIGAVKKGLGVSMDGVDISNAGYLHVIE
jgi:thiamine-monophosphate kinase